MHTPEQSFKNFKFKNPLSEKSKNQKIQNQKSKPKNQNIVSEKNKFKAHKNAMKKQRSKVKR
jgi:hypothetical protein